MMPELMTLLPIPKALPMALPPMAIERSPSRDMGLGGPLDFIFTPFFVVDCSLDSLVQQTLSRRAKAVRSQEIALAFAFAIAEAGASGFKSGLHCLDRTAGLDTHLLA